MGVDIHMSIIDKEGNYLEKDVFDGGRNSEWFANLQKDGWDDEYDHLPIHFGIPEKVPEKIQKDFDKPLGEGYYGFYYITVKGFKNWYENYKPDLKAGWASTYDKWRIEKKHYMPERGLPQYLHEEYNKEDIHFVEYIDYYDCSRWLYQHLRKNKFSDDAYIVYYFDH